MYITNKNIDKGKAFDWGRVSSDYAKYRDIYPQKFYDKIVSRGLCVKGQSVLDIGTGTGVLPRNLYRYGAKWTASDISEKQIVQAKNLSEGMEIEYYALRRKSLPFPMHPLTLLRLVSASGTLTIHKLCRICFGC